MPVERFRSLDGWRGVCALLVALYHLNAYGHFYEAAFLRNCWLFVDFFFVLSGFVVTHAYMRRLTGWREARAFIIRRFGRLWPLHVSVLLFLIGLEFAKAVLLSSGANGSQAAFSGDHSLGSLATNFFLIQSLGFQDGLTWNDPSWSISTEFYTYIVFAGVFLLARSATLSLVLSSCVAVLSAGVILSFAKQGFGSFDFVFVRTLYGFFIGHLTYRLWTTGTRPFAYRWIWFAEIGAVVSIVLFMSLFSFDGASLWGFAAPFAFAAVIWVFAHDHGPISRFMMSRPIALLGERSYSVYMVHAAILLMLNRAIALFGQRSGLSLTTDMSFRWTDKPVELIYWGNAWAIDGLAIVYLFAVVLVAGFTYRLIEQPGQRLFNAMPWAQSRKAVVSSSRDRDLVLEGKLS